MTAKARSLSGRQKAAILLIALGPELSGQVMKEFRPEDIESLTGQIFRMDKVSDEIEAAVLSECYEMALARSFVTTGGTDFAREMLVQGLGAQKASEVISRVMDTHRGYAFDFLRNVDPKLLTGFLQNLHPQTIALILSHLPPSTVAPTLQGLGPDLQADVALRIASMEQTAPDVIERVEGVIRDKISLVSSEDYSPAGGVPFIVKVLNNVDRGTEKAILEAFDTVDSELAAEVRKLMFIFEDILQLDDRSLQRVLREVDTNNLAMALKGASDQLKEHVFRNMSTRAADMLRDDIATSGPVRRRTIEAAQQQIVNLIRRLDEAEEIVISRGGEDVLV